MFKLKEKIELQEKLCIEAMTIKELINQQREFFSTGETFSYQCRKKALEALKESIKRYEPDIADALQKDLGKSTTESYITEIGMLLEDISYALKHLRRWMKPKRQSTPMTIFPGSSKVVNCPYGVVLVIAPWNYPILLSLQPLVGALAAGNCCVVKPSEAAPASADVIEKIVKEVLPESHAAVVNGGIETSKELLEEQFDYIFYTGNTNVGRTVMEKAARYLTPVTLELGGKSPVVVSRNANLRLAARRIAFGKLMNLGQTCVAPDYILVEREAHDSFIALLEEEITKMYGEKPLRNAAYGKIINHRHYERICRLIDKSKVVFGGECDETSLRIEPTIMDNVTAEDAVMAEEIFGPALPVITVENLDEAFLFIQQRPHPLALYIFTESKAEENRFINGLLFGGGCVNDVIVHLSNPNLPFGGIGPSGMGEYHGISTYETFSHKKSIVKSATYMDIPLRYPPYSEKTDKILRFFMKHFTLFIPFWKIATICFAAILVISSCTNDDPEPKYEDPGFISFIDQNTGELVSSDDVFKTGSYVEIDIEERGLPHLFEENKWLQTKYLFKKEESAFVLVKVFQGGGMEDYKDCTDTYKDIAVLEWCDKDKWRQWKDVVIYYQRPKFHFRLKSPLAPDDVTKDSLSIYYDGTYLYPDIGFKSISRTLVGFDVNGHSLLQNGVTIHADAEYHSDKTCFNRPTDVFRTGSYVEIDIEDRGVPYLHEQEMWFQTKFLFMKEETEFVLLEVYDGCISKGYENCTDSYKDIAVLEWCDKDKWWQWKDIVRNTYYPKFHFRIKSRLAPNDETKDSKSIYYDEERLYPNIGFKSISRNIVGFYVNGYDLLRNGVSISAGDEYYTDYNYYE